MTYWIFLDETRTPPAQPPYPHLAREAVTVRSYEEFQAVLDARGGPAFVSFGDGLGPEMSCLDCAQVLIEAAMDGAIQLPSDFSFEVHAEEPELAGNTKGLLTSFFKHMHPFHAFYRWAS